MQKLLKGLPGYLEREKGLPLVGKGDISYLLMSLPFGCNLSCLKCFSWTTRVHEDMPLETRKRVLEEAAGLGARVFVMPGEGEPLLYSGWRELVKFANGLGLITIIFTNCSRLDRETARFAFEYDVSFIVSLDSIDRETYDRLAGVDGLFDRVRINLEALREIYAPGIEQKGDCRVTRLALNTMVCLPNLGEIEGIKEWCGDDMVFIANSPVYEGRAKDNWPELTGMPAGENNPQLVESAKNNSETGGPTSARLDRMCAYLYNGLTVDSDGEVLVCPDARTSRGLVGNVKDSSLADLNSRIMGLIAEAKVPCIVRAPGLYSSLLESLR